MDKKALKAQVLGERKESKTIVRVGDVDFEVHAPTVGDIEKIQDETGFDLLAPGKMLARVQVWLTVLCTFWPGTGTKVFDASDIPELRLHEAGGLTTKLGMAAMQAFMGGQKKEQPSATVPAESSSSS